MKLPKDVERRLAELAKGWKYVDRETLLKDYRKVALIIILDVAYACEGYSFESMMSRYAIDD